MLFSPDLQLSSTTCWISPPRKGTLTNSSCSRFRADAKPVTKGTYLRELVGPAQFRMTKVLRLTHRKSLKGCGLVRRTHFRYRWRSIDTQGISGTFTPATTKHYVKYINTAMILLKLAHNGHPERTSEPTGSNRDELDLHPEDLHWISAVMLR